MACEWQGLKERAVTFDGEEYQTEARIIKTGKLYRRTQVLANPPARRAHLLGDAVPS